MAWPTITLDRYPRYIRFELADIRVRVGQATQQKVGALMQLAEANKRAKARPLPVASKQPGASGWRVWGGGGASPAPGAAAAEGEAAGAKQARAATQKRPRRPRLRRQRQRPAVPRRRRG